METAIYQFDLPRLLLYEGELAQIEGTEHVGKEESGNGNYQAHHGGHQCFTDPPGDPRGIGGGGTA